jgi:tetratricopeptide (TPR) repeat protein
MKPSRDSGGRPASASIAQPAAAALQAFQAAVALHEQGRLGEAEQRYRRVLEADGRHFGALYRLGLMQLQLGRFAEAADLFRQAAKVDRQSADAYHHHGVALTGLKRHEEAVRRYEKALAIRPDFAEAHNNLGYTLQTLGQFERAKTHYEKALALLPNYAEARNNLGIALSALGRHEDAVAQFKAAIALRPSYVEAHRSLANAFGALERYEEAAEHYQKVLASLPHDAEARTALGNTLFRLDRPDEAMAEYQKALAADPNYAEARNSLGNTLHRAGRSQEALTHFHRSLAIDPTDARTHANLGALLVALGRTSEANAAFEKAADLSPRKAGHYWNLASARRFAADDRHFVAMQKLASKANSLEVAEQIDLNFALGKAFADVGDQRRSFDHMLAGNALKRQQINYDEAKALAHLERIRAAFTAGLIGEKGGRGDPSLLPVFIVGMPRSGTTLIEQILASHPAVFGAGELRHMTKLSGQIGATDTTDATGFPEAVGCLSPEALRDIGTRYVEAVQRLAPDAQRITDKMPGNFSFAGLIHLALPNARIIHACRDARDTAFSCFSLLFATGLEFTYDLGELGRYYRGYQALMAHWREVLPEGVMLEVHYEQLVADLEGEVRRIIAHCGLEWDDACLSFYNTERSVLTASATQVRRPIYQSSIGRWRAHADRLQPLLRALEPPSGP